MKQFFLLVIFSCTVMLSTAQKLFTSINDDQQEGGLILNGLLTQKDLESESSFKWFNQNKIGYQPDSSIITSINNIQKDYSFIVFGGTWCDDTQFILPRFFKLMDIVQIPETFITLFGVDRNKKTIGNIATAFAITNVPTIIVLKNGKEVGRVVEYGASGKWDEELVKLLSNN